MMLSIIGAILIGVVLLSVFNYLLFLAWEQIDGVNEPHTYGGKTRNK